ncbi:auxin transport protein BIG [Coffea eugenioides]|uniref:auxin transport protein BIG n=1 Tax=Coffea eugenioides TaxID=49369 RepID=UPI000F608133|nr:auxin transport protein BIG [Coffea eugenioides]
MADQEIAKLIDALSSLSSSFSDDNFSKRLGTDSSLKLGLQKLYSILKYSVSPIAAVADGRDKKRGLEFLEQSQIQAVASLATAVVIATRSLSVEHVEPVIVAVVQKSVEFALCFLDKSVSGNEDLSLQNNFLQLLEIALNDRVDKELDLPQPYASSILVDLIPFVAVEDDSIQVQDYVKCMLQGGRCSVEEKAVDHLLMTLASEELQSDDLNQLSIGLSFRRDFMKLNALSRHQALVHLECMPRLVFLCRGLLGLQDLLDEKIASADLRKRMSFCARIFKLLGYLAKGNPYVKVDAALLQSFASFADILPKAFGIGLEFVNNATGEGSFDSLTILLMEEFLQLVQAVFHSSNVLQNVQACITASILDHLDSSVWQYNKSTSNLKPPLVYFPRVVIHVIKLIMVVRKSSYSVFQLKDNGTKHDGHPDGFDMNSPACQVRSEKIYLLKKYTAEELLTRIFPPSGQWVDNLVNLVFFLHSEGVKLRPKLERSCSTSIKASNEPENAACHEDDALFGDLFSESGRSVGSVDGLDQTAPAASSLSNFSNMPIQAAMELLSFLKNDVLSPNWSPGVYEDGCRKLTCEHMGILLSIMNHQGYSSEERTLGSCVTLDEQKKLEQMPELCFELFNSLLSQHSLSAVVEESLIEKILAIENGSFVYNDQTLALLAHALISQVDSVGCHLRAKIYQTFINFVLEKAKTICSSCPSLQEFLKTLPSVFHIEILLMGFHLSSTDEKAAQVNAIFSSLRTVDAPSSGCGSATLSCWALLVSRLVLVLRHMLYCPHGCPSSLLSVFRSKLTEASHRRANSLSNTNNLSSWTPMILENVTGVWIKEAPVNKILLNQLIDIATLPASVFGDDAPPVDCLNMTWDELSASLSWILGFWKGKKPGNAEDLIVERYMFLLCWDVPIMESTSERVLLLRGLELPHVLEIEHFLYFSHSILSNAGALSKQVNIPLVVMGLLQHLHTLCISDDCGEGGWDFLLTGSWLTLMSSLVGAGIWRYSKKNSITSGGPSWEELTSKDVEFLALAESFLSSSLGDDQIATLVRLFSSFLKNYLRAYQKAFSLTFDNDSSSADRFSPLLLLKHTSFDKSKQVEVLDKMGHDPCQLDSVFELLPKLGETVDKMAVGYRSKVFWEVSLHGFPCHAQASSGILLSCILSIKGIIGVLDGLLKVKVAKGTVFTEVEVLRQILESVLTIKCDRVFESIHGECEAIYKSLSGNLGPEYSSLFILKNMEEFLHNINNVGVDCTIHECLVTNFIDIINGLRKDPSKGLIFKYFLSVGDISEHFRELYSALHGDVLVLIESLDNCNSESINVKVLNFFVDLLSGDMCPDVKQKLQQKFLDIDLQCLSKWLEQRLLGSCLEPSSEVTCAKGTSVSLRESTINFITCILSPPFESKSEELHTHLFEAMLVPLDNAFLLFDFGIAKSYFNIMLQLSRGKMLIKPLLQHTAMLLGKLGGDERFLQGLKYIFGFLATVLSECGSVKNSNDKSSGKVLPGGSSVVGPVSPRPLGSRKNSDALVLSVSQGAAAAVDCDATSVDEDEDDGTSDGEVGSVDKDDEEDSNSERALASKVCTFTSSGSNFMEQHWYFCYTCDLTVSKGCCSVCAKVCHRGHRVVYSRSSRFFCDCGAGGVRGSSCLCLKPRKFTRGHDSPRHGADGNLQSFLPFPENGDQLPESDSDVDEDAVVEQDYAVKLSIPKEVQDGMPEFLAELDLEDHVLELCSSLLPSIIGRRDSNLSRERRITLDEDKVLCCSAEILQLKKAYKSGSLDLKIKADYSNSKELKSHLSSGSLVKSLLSVSSRGRLAVGEGDKVAIFDVGQLIGQATVAPVTADKANVKPLSKNVVRFEIVHIVFNSVVDNYLAVAGYEDCQVLTVNHRGEVTDRLAIELALQGAYIRRVDWVPGSQVQLMVITNKFVKIFDLSQDNISPMHYVTLSDDMIVDATLVMSSLGRVFLIVLSESGYLYRLELSMKGNVGVKVLKEIIQTEGREIHSKGLSLCYSSSHKLLFMSYQDGSTLIGRLNPDATSVIEVCALLDSEPDGKLRAAGLHHWKELQCGIGLFFCFSSLKSNAAFTVSICEHEIHAQNMRHAVGSTSALVGITAYKPLSKDKIHCLVLHDDGSLQIYWHVPMGVDNSATATSEKVKKLGSGILNNKAYGGVKPEFPLDFFEKTVVITPEVKLSGDAIRNGDSEGAKQTLASEDGFLEGPSPSAFKITVANSNPDTVVVGIRVHVGNTSANHIPSEITIFQRVIKLDEGMRSWYDIPFTVAESLLADEEFSISIGPTFNGSALPRIDSLEVYGRAKDEFGWKEKMDAILDMEARVLGSNSWISESRRKCRTTQSAPLPEQVVSDGLKLLSRIYSCKSQDSLKVQEANLELNKVKCKKLLETIFESDREPLLLASAGRVLQALFPKKEEYHQVKDTMRLSGVVKSTSILSSKLGIGGNTAGWIIEEFTAQMRAVSKIALHRRSNLAAFLEANGSEVVDGLMQVLWGILDMEHPDTQTMNNIVVSSVELIYCYAECLALHANDTGTHHVAPAVSLFKELLFSKNEAVQTSSSLAISSRLLQVPFPKQTMLGTEDVSDNAAAVPARVDGTSAATGNTHIMVEEDNITSSVQYCCDGCSTVPILRRRWHCTVCPDFDLCEACYEVLDADRLPPPHSRDHPMTAIPIEVESLSGEGNEIHFGTDDLADPNLLPVSADMSIQSAARSIHELEPSESTVFTGSVFDPVTISASKRIVNSLVLSELLEQLKGWMATTSGVQAIPIMQLFYRLSSAMGGPFDDGSEPENVDLEKLVKWFLDEINLNQPLVARSRSSFGEVVILVFMFFTLMLRNWNQPGSDGSALKLSSTGDGHDKNSVQIPPFSLVSGSPTVESHEKLDSVSHLVRACGLLRQQSFVNYLMDILQQLVHVFKSSSVSTDSSVGLNSGCGSLLTIRRELPAGNFSPFFSDAYAKSHRTDIFADYPRLLLENTFRLVYSLIRPEKHDKGGEKDKYFKTSSCKDLKLEGYQDILCSYINNPHTTFVRRYARRLFLHLCGSKTHYYSVRDSWQVSSEVKKLYKHVNKSGGFQSPISYERSVKIVKCLSTMAEVAAARPRNWQKYCMRHADVLPYLVQGIFYFGEECVVQTLKLLSLAFYTGKDVNQSLHKSEGGEGGTSSSKSGSQPLDSKKKKKGEEGNEPGLEKSYLDMEPVVDVFTENDGDTLRQFIDLFLLEWNSSSVRVEAKCVLNGIWHHGNHPFKEKFLTLLLQKVKFLPMYGQNIIEYTQLVTSLLGRTPDSNSKQQMNEIIDRCLTPEVIKCMFETLRSQNELLANHPNSRIYNTLSGLVEFDGYYLESEPCVACSSPEVPYSRMKLESLKSETKFTDNRIIVKCTGSYTIQSVTMNVHDARKSKSVKVLNLYYNNRPVADLSELKNNWSLWKRAKTCHLGFNQTELKVDFPIPITACNFMIELDSFYENLQALSLEPLQCPRCSRPVTDKHGICSNCHENAYQCRQCRNINYENLDSFLCNECGYSKYGRFEFNFMAKPSFTFDNMENDEDMKRGLTAIESESENAHRRYQQLLGFKKPLLKIVSSIGENEMDSQQKDSVQQMMASLSGPSYKINRKIALLGVLYGEKCKAAFDSVSKSVQTLQGLRRVLMNYLHLKHSDDAVSASRFVVSRSANSCYGCATTFVAQCLEMLQVLSKHSNSKKQLVTAGILTELFENNIHQGPKTARVQARAALCAFSEGDMNAVVELNSLIQKKVLYCLEHHRSMDIALATREELLLLSDVCSLGDEFWELRLRVAFQLLFSSIKLGAKHPAISEHVILPCLRIISLACTPPKPDAAEKEQVNGKPALASQVKDENRSNVPGYGGQVSGSKAVSESSEKNWDGAQKTQDIQLLSYSEWEKGASYLDFVRRQYKVSQAVKSGPRARPNRYDYLALKYALRWKRRACKARGGIASFELGSWVTELILSACSQSIRSEMCMLISLLCGQSSSRHYRLLILLMSLLPATLAAGENAAEYFELLFKMIDSEDARLFLTVRGGLATLCKLISKEVSNIESCERSLHIDISQGFILHKLIELLGKFLEVRNIRSRFMQEQLLSEVLEALIVIRGLIVQKTKLICDCNRLLKDLLDSLLLESDENKHQFIQACICGLQIHGEERKGRASLFILEQLCNLICPSKPEAVYLLILNKAHTQEEFIRGSMTKNPYSSAEIGPLMRDVKNKICHQLDLLGLLEDDYGMELLVAGNIISLDLSISQVYEQVWKKSNNQSSNALAGTTMLSSGGTASSRDCPPMTVTYRLQGLDGEATEPMIKELDEDREESQDPEVEFAIAGAVRKCGGLEILLGMVQRLRDDLKSNQEQLIAVLDLLMLCCKKRENRRALLKLGALSLLLETARRAFFVDAMEPAEGILLIVESLTLEANESENISIAPGVAAVSSEETGASEQAKKIVLMFLERLSHPTGLKKSSKQQRNTEMVARILPYLTYGEPAAMEALIDHFDPYLRNWSQFDRLQRQYEDNPRDESIAQQANKQKFALENFVRVSESLKTSSCGERLKDIILEKGITGAAVRHLKDTFAYTGQAGFKSSKEWVFGLKLPSVPVILSMLRGLSLGHLATQMCIYEGGILPLLHTLEGVAGENEIGARAENLLDTLSDKDGMGDGFLSEKVCHLRHATRDEMRRRALRKREELLKGLGMRQEVSSDGGERIVVSQPVLEGFEDVEEEEDGLACMVCREGYRLRPTDLLGVYTYSKRVNLGVGTSGNARGDCVYTTVSHFNIIHFQCHQEAKRADAALKNPKKEWDGAALRNNETLCNNLFPLRGPSVPMSQYTRYVDQYWDYLNALGRADGSRLRLLTYDIVLMLARFATGASFSADSRGGGKESNSLFLPFMIQMARHFLDHDSSQRQAMEKSISSYLASSSLELKSSSPGTQPSAGTEETVQFMMVSSLLSESYESWLEHRRTFLQRGIYHAYMQRIHGRPMNRSSPSLTSSLRPDLGSTSDIHSGDTGGPDDLLSIIQPMLVYAGLIEQLQHFFKVKKSATAGTAKTQISSKAVEPEEESKRLEMWEVLMKEKLLNVKEMVGFSKELLSWLDDMMSATDLLEAFDIIGSLADVLSGGFTRPEEFVYAAIGRS